MFLSIRDFKTRHVLTIKYISASKETLKLLLNNRIIPSSNKIQLSQKQQFVNYFDQNLSKTRQQNFKLRWYRAGDLF